VWVSSLEAWCASTGRTREARSQYPGWLDCGEPSVSHDDPSTPPPAPAPPPEPEPYNPGPPNPELMITFERGLQVPQPPLTDIEEKEGETR